MRPPGNLQELGETGKERWSELVGARVRAIAARLAKDGREPRGVGPSDAAEADIRTIEWQAFPAQIGAKLGTKRALAELDRRDPVRGNVGRELQEEYLEWRLIRDGERTVGVEMTTELRDYWTVLAAHEPQRTLELVGAFAGGEAVPDASVYGSELGDPLAASVTPDERAAAFEATMLPAYEGPARPFSPLNDGREALCCMVQASNGLDAVLELVLSAARPLLVDDAVTGQRRYPSGREAIDRLRVSAQAGRNSDPLIVERIVRFVGEGRQVSFDDPVGVYIGQLQLQELEQPDGEEVPSAWVELGRGVLAANSPDGRSRAQRLKLELPPDADFSLTDLIVRRTGERLRFGGQLAELVELCAYVRTGPSEPPAR